MQFRCPRKFIDLRRRPETFAGTIIAPENARVAICADALSCHYENYYQCMPVHNDVSFAAEGKPTVRIPLKMHCNGLRPACTFYLISNPKTQMGFGLIALPFWTEVINGRGTIRHCRNNQAIRTFCFNSKLPTISSPSSQAFVKMFFLKTIVSGPKKVGEVEGLRVKKIIFTSKVSGTLQIVQKK